MLGIFGDLIPRFYFHNLYFCKVNSPVPIFRGSFYIHLHQRHPQCYMKMLGIFGDLKPRFFSQNVYSCKVNSSFPIVRGHLLYIYPLLEFSITHYIHHKELEIQKNAQPLRRKQFYNYFEVLHSAVYTLFG